MSSMVSKTGSGVETSLGSAVSAIPFSASSSPCRSVSLDLGPASRGSRRRRREPALAATHVRPRRRTCLHPTMERLDTTGKTLVTAGACSPSACPWRCASVMLPEA